MSVHSQRHDPALTLGMAAIVRLAYEGGDLEGLLGRLVARIEQDPADAAALMDLYTLLQTTGQKEQALSVQAMALGLRRIYHRPHGRGDGLKILAFVAAGDFMTNTPIDLLLEGTDLDLWLVFVDAETTVLKDLPDHDVAFLAIGETAENMPILANIETLLAHWPAPVVNGAPKAIAALTRNEVCTLFEDEPTIYAPKTVRVGRETLASFIKGDLALRSVLPDADFPLIIRPVGTHAGQGLEKLEDVSAMADYLARHNDPDLYLAPFVDYRGADGLFRKQRIAFIDGQAFPSHFAVSEDWMVHYLSAKMTEFAERRAEEEAWMRDFDIDFAARHAEAFAALHRRLGLDYFGIDCAEMPDGRLLLFEADVAMIVHALDPDSTFPYKKPAMRKLFDAFADAMVRRAA